MNSVAKHFGLKATHPTLPIVDKELRKKYKNVVVMLLDGLGMNILRHHLSETSFLRSNLRHELSAVYPSSTVPSTVSFKTGLTPIEHGWWGHFLYFKTLGQTVNVFTNNEMCSRKKVLIENVAHKIMPYTSLLDEVSEHKKTMKAYMLCPPEARDEFHISQLSYENFGEMCNYIRTLTTLPERHLIYAYHDHPDETMHKFGIDSEETSKMLVELDSQISSILSECEDTLLLITADHGQTSLKETRDIADLPEMMDMLSILPNGCSRATNFFVKSGCKRNFEKLVHHYFDDKFLLFTKDEVIEKNLLGVGNPHPEFYDTFGDYMLCAIDNCEIICSTIFGHPAPSPLGVHGGLTIDEMKVPLIIYGKK